MKQIEKLKYFFSEKIILHPILIGILFITTSLYSNWLISTSNNKLFFIVLVMVFCVAVNRLSRSLVRNRIKASLIATLFITINLYYKYIEKILSEFSLFKWFMDLFINERFGWFIFASIYISFLAVAFIISKTRKKLFSLNLYLNVVISLFLAYEVGSIIFTKPFNVELVNTPKQQEKKLINSLILDKPNVYFIILDAYTSSESLKKYWAYDNSSFENSLTKMGFFVTHTSKSDYDFTPYCMASYLNMSLIKVYNIQLLSQRWNWQKDHVLKLIENSSLIQQFVSSGYKFINYSIFNIGNDKALFYTPFPKGNEPIAVFFQQTIYPYINYKIKRFTQSSEQFPSYPNLKFFKLLSEKYPLKSEVPKFYYAHILMPHQPFEYDENGNKMSYEYSTLIKNDSYLKLLRYTNSMVIKTIQNILTNEKKKPFIIIQGDHGYRFLENVDTKIQKTEGHTIFSAYLYPNELKIQLNDSIKPIEALSLLFDEK